MDFQLTLLQQFLINSAKRFSQKIGLIIANKTYTYEIILQLAWSFAQKLKQQGVQRGDRVVIQAGNSLLTVIAFWGTLLADAIAAVIATDITQEKCHSILQDAGAAIFITDTTILCDDLLTWPDNYRSANQELDLATIIYTSGSTGEPKGVMLTHRNMLAATASINHYLNHVADDIILCALPLSFDYGLYQMIMAFSMGATLVLEKDALFPARLLHAIEKHKVTVLPGVPTLFNLLSEHATHFSYDYSTLRAVTNTGAALSQNHIQKMQRLFPRALLFSMYGLTECKRCTYLPPEDLQRKAGSVGIAIPNTEIWIVDEHDQKVPPGTLGQLVVRGATVMRGYWNKPQATAEKLKAGPIPGEKVLYTGDWGILDAEGYFYFKGRMDETFKFKGIKVNPVEIEMQINSLPDVKETAVLGLSASEEIQLIVCVVPTKQNSTNEQMEIIVREKILASVHPSHIFVLPQLPKTNNGKINKLALRHLVINKVQGETVVA